LFRGLIVVFFLTFIAQAATEIVATARVYVDASLQRLVGAPVPNYPLEAFEKKWGGLGF
jgi:hypothetical protein